jgi:hypothetical protein
VRITQSGPDQQLLRQAIERGEGGALSVVSGRRALKGDSVLTAVRGPMRRVKSRGVKHHASTPFAAKIPVCSRVERVAASPNRRHPRQRGAHVSARVQDRIGPDHKCERALILLQAASADVRSH